MQNNADNVFLPEQHGKKRLEKNSTTSFAFHHFKNEIRLQLFFYLRCIQIVGSVPVA